MIGKKDGDIPYRVVSDLKAAVLIDGLIEDSKIPCVRLEIHVLEQRDHGIEGEERDDDQPNAVFSQEAGEARETLEEARTKVPKLFDTPWNFLSRPGPSIAGDRPCGWWIIIHLESAAFGQ